VEGIGHSISKVVFWHSFGGTEENHEKLKLISILAVI
jgi:hypothetical protein